MVVVVCGGVEVMGVVFRNAFADKRDRSLLLFTPFPLFLFLNVDVLYEMVAAMLQA